MDTPKKPKLVVYAICKNERDNTDAWYDSMREADEVIVLDTGSDDGTPERLEELGAAVYRDYPGPFRFDTARNGSLAHVPDDADICFSVDLDERFHERGWAEAFKKAWLDAPGCNALQYRFVMNQIEKDGKLVDDSVFEKDNAHSRRGWHWKYPVHNLLVPDEGTRPVYGRVPDRFSLYHHQQYRPDRADRIGLHILNVQELPNAARPHYYLAREFYYRREWAKAVDEFDRYLEVVGENCWHDEKGNALYLQALCWEQIGNKRFAELSALRAVCETAGREPLLFLVKMYYQDQKWFPAKYYAEMGLRFEDNKAYFRSPSAYGPIFHDYLTMIYHHLGDRARAAESARICLEMEPGNRRYQSNAAFFSVSLGNKPAEEKPAAEEGIAVAYSITGDYAEHLAVSLHSLLKYNRVRAVYVMIGSGSGPVAEIEQLCRNYGVRHIRWIPLDEKIEEAFPADGPNRNSYYTDAALGRVLLPRLVEEPKILYFDCDTLVRASLDELWNTGMEGKALAGCRKINWPELDRWTETVIEGGCPEYINSGVLLMNLDELRASGLDAEAIRILNSKKLLMPDQDALNAACRGKIAVLPNKFNSSYSCGHADPPVVEHYAGDREFYENPAWLAEKKSYAEYLRVDGVGPGINLESGGDVQPQIKVHAPTKTVGIAVAANGIDRETIDEFLQNRQFLSPGDEIYINDKPVIGPFNPARNKNIALAEAIRAGHDVVVQTDIDMRLSRELIEQTRAQVKDGNYVFKYCKNEDGHHRTEGFGAWNALTAADWLKSGGLDERMFGYGCEDTAFFFRMRELGFKTILTDDFEPVHLKHKTDRTWLRLDRKQRARNAILMDVPYTRNYLQGRIDGFSDAVKRHIEHMQFYVTSACRRACPECSQQHYMKATRGWEASIEEVDYFIGCAEMQGHVFRSVVLSGGDPYLWKPLEEAVRLFKRSPAFQTVTIFTGMIDDNLTRRIEDSVDRIVFSDYGRLPDYVPRNMVFDHRVREHFIQPETEVPETLPARCICQGPRVQGNRVFSCSNISDILLRSGERLEQETYSEPLTSQFIDMYYGFDLTGDAHCAKCIGNTRVQEHCGTVDNTQQKVYQIA